ncbi:sigma 54-interacting transcriptional regulator [Proteiniborus sp. MB09-C3]|uniref:sigma-54 interaction domain-containing protein n=1 Tax=Proteiniborus sp. MB09-C3 TaxID=3050072 RepID=UPI002557A623|nr:sigma 54-interacting transcriptional regulator [Proteiniborus sp. MB09-C3]WIV12264.1 sigma 54-interacting transcriptional regulator [Proteiniborus sp. MB09-C3]
MIDLLLGESISELLDYVQEGIHIIDNTGKIIYYNKFAQKIDEIDREKAVGRHILEIYPSLSHDTSTLLKVIRTGKPIFDVEQTFVNYKGDKITTINSSIPIKSKGRIAGALEISKDITEVRKLSEKIVELQSELYSTEHSGKQKEKRTAGFTFVDIIGQNAEMLKIKSIALKAAETSSPVIIYGETGTGKELFVQSIHNASPRKNKPFIAQNCAALPSNLLEGILFGTVKGGFTGAEDRPGLFEVADGGTLLLDEINSMPLDLQAKLLRAIQDKTVRRVGAIKTTKVDVRIIAAINIHPEKAIEEKLLRKDLYYRLNVVSINIPELRDRTDDIPRLADYFIQKYNKLLRKNIRKIDDEAMELFMNYTWPGNVRELEHLIEGIATIYDTEIIKLEHLPSQILRQGDVSLVLSRGQERQGDVSLVLPTEDFSSVSSVKYHPDIDSTSYADEGAIHEGSLIGSLAARPFANLQNDKNVMNPGELKRTAHIVPLKMALESMEKEMIHNTLVATDWNITHTAEQLDLPRQTLQYKIKKYGLTK